MVEELGVVVVVVVVVVVAENRKIFFRKFLVACREGKTLTSVKINKIRKILSRKEAFSKAGRCYEEASIDP